MALQEKVNSYSLRTSKAWSAIPFITSTGQVIECSFGTLQPQSVETIISLLTITLPAHGSKEQFGWRIWILLKGAIVGVFSFSRPNWRWRSKGAVYRSIATWILFVARAAFFTIISRQTKATTPLIAQTFIFTIWSRWTLISHGAIAPIPWNNVKNSEIRYSMHQRLEK